METGTAIQSRDHPRVCGEKDNPDYVQMFSGGSPPRVRGKASDSLMSLLDYGITPACAGKSLLSQIEICGVRDHPRVCGEKSAPAYVNVVNEGSPPRVRGKAARKHVFMRTVRITPACAGKSSTQTRFYAYC